jgi:hypothetical protein
VADKLRYEITEIDIDDVVTDTLADVGEPVRLHGVHTGIAIEVENYDTEEVNGSNALNAFAVLIQPHPDAAFHTLLSGSGWAALDDPDFADALNSLTTEAKGVAVFRLGPVHAVKFRASVAANTTGVKIKGLAARV